MVQEDRWVHEQWKMAGKRRRIKGHTRQSIVILISVLLDCDARDVVFIQN